MYNTFHSQQALYCVNVKADCYIMCQSCYKNVKFCVNFTKFDVLLYRLIQTEQFDTFPTYLTKLYQNIEFSSPKI